MSRMFRVISGPVVEPAGTRRDPSDAGDIPFIEVGGPDGVVTSIQPPTVAIHKPPAPSVAPPPAFIPPAAPFVPPASLFVPATPRPASAPTPAAARATPSAAPESPILSVTFHRYPKPGLRLMHHGVAPEVVAFHFPDHPVSAEYRRVCEEVLQQYDGPGPRAAVFTAAEPHAGTTTVLVNFAVSLVTQHAHRVLAVDANFARPGLARLLACAEAPGLADVLGQSIPLAWALQPTPLPNLHVLSTGAVNDGTEEALAADLPRLVAQLRQWFDWVVIDGGVWAELPGGDGTGAAADGVYLVTREADMERDEFTGLRAEITAAGGPVRGYVSTRQ
jgi:Mrp family chromosome partitioning ATPase